MTTVEIRTQTMYSQLSNSEKLVADYILKNRENIFRYPLAKLAEQSGTSQGAWVRFCKSIGFDGMKDLKKSLFVEMNDTITESGTSAPLLQFTDIKEHSTFSSMAENVCYSSIQAIEATLKLFDEEMLKKTVNKIIHARTIRLFGVGASGLVASDLFHKLLRIGYNVTFCQDTHVSLTYASTLTEEDIAILFSNSGETKEIIEILEIAQKNKATTLAITKFGKSHLAMNSDLVLYTSSPEIYKRSGAMSSRIAQLILNDILFTAIANRDYENVEELLEVSYESCSSHRLTD
ncbi:MurR/RpiR family transcriptional regulator [Anaerocolumna aminovalerica]|jgi:DNA-binding MurR/RpiR family transcriptional regulator|uniref:MurR/RpiR family transcriptional regulator n=1 Tax=Anaerocolumna aminovalerica TaxID=1527 RepID=UPI000BE27FF1|nr:MurR/RpiR family transcriptional regulator [Anaerocolumna aminovalerica]MBU5332549.1 MurR/RpiR family transcriptional regulator [Anaerocolumna aminovalerica]MDU6266432.1 MurR/RpiR family transcriptional regulator [Anaerocolumna aminovalerica]